ncbi:MAG: DUF1080 domain-containing protein [Pirellulaceae bacterium]
MSRPRPQAVQTNPALPVPPPSDAVILFDGSDLSQWRSATGEAAGWVVHEGYLESVPDSGYLYTVRGFGDCQLHVEWSSPVKVMGDGQGRGNSGVFLMSRYEVQVLDSFDNVTYPDGQAGAVYGQYPPLVNASRKPGEWQSYDIVFRRPRFRRDGSLLKPAVITVLQNGVLVQDHVEIWGGTSWLKHLPYDNHADRMPLALQDHGNPVRYRNIWLRELPEQQPAGPAEDRRPVIAIAERAIGNYVGDFLRDDGAAVWITAPQGRLHLQLEGSRQPLELVAHSTTEFSFRHLAGGLTFELDESKLATRLVMEYGGTKIEARRK